MARRRHERRDVAWLVQAGARTWQSLPDASLGGVIATQVIEHLEPSS